MNESFAVFGERCPDSDIPLIRELIAYDVQCPTSCLFSRGKFDSLALVNPPSPLHWSRQMEWPWIIRQAELSPRLKVLDMGSGWSILKFALAKRCNRGLVVCADNSQEALDKANETVNLLGYNNIGMCLADITLTLPWDDNTFDRVVCCSVLEHVEGDKIHGVQELARVLKPGGILLLTMDVVISGPVGKGNFYVDPLEAFEILQALNIPHVNAGKVAGAELSDLGIQIAALMVKYYKPEKS